MLILKVLKFVWHIPRNILILLVKGYQKTLSLDHGVLRHLYPNGYCRFNPTCSMYAIESLKKHGAVYGGLKAFWRVLRCNPWGKGGNDEVK
jgi:uncharacterized protein